MIIDVDKLRRDMKNDSLGAFYGGGFGGALMEAFDIESASPEKLVRTVQSRGIDLREYKIKQ